MTQLHRRTVRWWCGFFVKAPGGRNLCNKESPKNITIAPGGAIPLTTLVKIATKVQLQKKNF